MARILIVKRMGYGSKEISNVKINKFIAIIVGATVIWVASCLLLRKENSQRNGQRILTFYNFMEKYVAGTVF